ncbi:MAG: ATP-binding cassette domain-containing protein [Caldilineaceae bacterium]|nr:ATP-binding cassette domain-containing protein [Caldilineaceae bacterium]
MQQPLIEIRDLKKHYPIRRGLLKRTVGHVRAVDGVSFSIQPGETVGLVGESGCGKTTAGRCLIRLVEPTSGEILFRDGEQDALSVAQLDAAQLKLYRRQVQIIFQDPYSSLDPRMSVFDIVSEPLRIHKVYAGSELEDRVIYLLKAVGLQSHHMRRYPHAFSGGQRQRIGIARALALAPKMVVCDEPVSALDVSIQAQVLNLLTNLQQQFGLTYLFISHDLSVVQHISNRVAVMYVGKIVEVAATQELFQHPLHPYTEALISAVPKPDPQARSQRILLAGDVANSANPPSGCYFHPRCRFAQEICKTDEPAMREVLPNHFVTCHLAEELTLRGLG